MLGSLRIGLIISISGLIRGYFCSNVFNSGSSSFLTASSNIVSHNVHNSPLLTLNFLDLCECFILCILSYTSLCFLNFLDVHNPTFVHNSLLKSLEDIICSKPCKISVKAGYFVSSSFKAGINSFLIAVFAKVSHNSHPISKFFLTNFINLNFFALHNPTLVHNVLSILGSLKIGLIISISGLIRGYFCSNVFNSGSSSFLTASSSSVSHKVHNTLSLG